MPAFADQPGDLLGVLLDQPEADGGIVPRIPTTPARQLLGVEPVAVLACGARRPSRSPRRRAPRRRRAGEAAHLVPLPLADLGAGDVADVVDVEEQERAAVGLLQRVLGAAQAVAAQPVVVDAALEVDRRCGPRRAGACPSASSGRCRRAAGCAGRVRSSKSLRCARGAPLCRRAGRVTGCTSRRRCGSSGRSCSRCRGWRGTPPCP